MISPKNSGDFTALQKYPAGKQELFTRHFISLFPILKINILLHFLKRKRSCKKNLTKTHTTTNNNLYFSTSCNGIRNTGILFQLQNTNMVKVQIS